MAHAAEVTGFGRLCGANTGNDWPMNTKRSLGDNALTLSALLLAGAVAAWTAWVWYGRWCDAENRVRASGGHPINRTRRRILTAKAIAPSVRFVVTFVVAAIAHRRHLDAARTASRQA